MSDKRICYLENGDLFVITPANSFVAKFATENEAIQALIGKDVPNGATDVIVVDAADLPQDRKFRNAWRLRNGRVEEDEQECRNAVVNHCDHLKKIKARDLLEREMMGENVEAEKAKLRAFNPNAHVANKSVAQLRAEDVYDPPDIK